MALVDDVEFFGSRVDAGDIDREEAARLLAEVSGGGITVEGARQVIGTWHGVRAHLINQQEQTEAALRRLYAQRGEAS